MKITFTADVPLKRSWHGTVLREELIKATSTVVDRFNIPGTPYTMSFTEKGGK